MFKELYSRLKPVMDALDGLFHARSLARPSARQLTGIVNSLAHDAGLLCLILRDGIRAPSRPRARALSTCRLQHAGATRDRRGGSEREWCVPRRKTREPEE